MLNRPSGWVTTVTVYSKSLQGSTAYSYPVYRYRSGNKLRSVSLHQSQVETVKQAIHQREPIANILEMLGRVAC
jgi:hypothetical protein